MASETDEIGWRLEKYVGALQELLSDLKKENSRPCAEVLSEYKRRVDLLQGLTEAEKMSSAADKALAADMLAPASRAAEHCQPSRELHLQKKAHYHGEMRDELLGKQEENNTTTASSAGVRQRQLVGNQKKPEQEEDLDTVLKHHNQLQEKLADEMLNLARNLKDNATVANRIVKDDNTRLNETTQMADSNFGKLKVESDRLETHVNKSCNWWIWIMLALVGITFIWMVLFMRMFPK